MTAESEAQRRDDYLQHLIRMCDLGHKAYAWRAAKAYEKLDPYCLHGLQDALAEAMKTRAAEVVAA